MIQRERSHRIYDRFTGWFFADIPATRLAALRVLIVGFALCYLLGRADHLTDFSQFREASFKPVGPVNLLTSPLPSPLVYAVFAICSLSGIAALLGFRYAASGPLFAGTLLWVISYRNSWGMVFHTENLFVFHVLVLAVAPAADRWAVNSSPDAAATRRQEQNGVYSWPIKTLSLLTVAAYTLAGMAKLEIAGPGWADGEELRAHIAYDAVRKIALGSWSSPIAGPMVKQAWLFAPLAWLTLLFELGAPLALFSRRLSHVWSLVAWSFHFGVLLTMAIVFPYPLVGIAFASFFEPEKFATRRLLPFLKRADA